MKNIGLPEIRHSSLELFVIPNQFCGFTVALKVRISLNP